MCKCSDDNESQQELPVDEVELQLTGRENSKLSFTSHVSAIAPGSNKLTLFCPVRFANIEPLTPAIH